MKKILCFSIILFLITPKFLFPNIILNEVMYNPIGSEHHTEFVEIYNNGNESVDLTGYKISDGSEIDELVLYPNFTNMVLNSNCYCIIMDSSYPENSIYYEELIPDTVLRVVIEDGSFGSYGFNNTIAETLFVYNSNNVIVDNYVYSIDQEPGYSDEIIINTFGGVTSGWSNSLVINGTPGFKNSVSPWDFDLTLIAKDDFSHSVELGDELEIDFIVKNIGLNRVDMFRYNIMLDSILISSYDFVGNLNVNDSILFSETILFDNNIPGNRIITFELETEDDGNLVNNVFEEEIFVNYSSENTLSLNEFKRNPSPNECEWIEIINISNSNVVISDFCFSDSQHNNYTEYIALNSNYILAPDSFFVIAKDSSIYAAYSFSSNSLEKIEVNSNFPALNNSDDKIFLYTRSGTIIDSISYHSDSWYEDDAGKSIEKINQSLESENTDNWNISVDFGTPCKVNSIYQNINDYTNDERKNFVELISKSVSPNNDGNKDNLLVNFDFESSFVYITATAFNIKGQKVKEILNNDYRRGDGTIIWNCKDYKNYNIPIGAYILYIKVKNDKGKFFEFKKAFYVVG